MAKGGSQTTSVEIPDWLEAAAQDAITRAQSAAGVGYMPWTGPDVAALTPLQNAAMGSTNAAASAFGLPQAGSGLPAPQTFAGGVQGYSSYPMYQQALGQIDPAQLARYNAAMGWTQPATGGQQTEQPPATTGPKGGKQVISNHAPGRETSGEGDRMTRGFQTGNPGAGFTSVRDMFDGGGAGASGPNGGVIGAAGGLLDFIRRR